MKLGKHYVGKVVRYKGKQSYTKTSWRRATLLHKGKSKLETLAETIEAERLAEDKDNQNKSISLEDIVSLFEIVFCVLFAVVICYLGLKW